MGLSFRDYVRAVPPANRKFHESAELAVCYKLGILPLDDDEQPTADDIDDPTETKIRH